MHGEGMVTDPYTLREYHDTLVIRYLAIHKGLHIYYSQRRAIAWKIFSRQKMSAPQSRIGSIVIQ